MTAQEFRDAAELMARVDDDYWRQLLLAAAEQCDQLDRYKKLALDQDRRLLQKTVTITNPLWGAVTKARLEAERDEARTLLATAKREAVEAFYAAVMARVGDQMFNDPDLPQWRALWPALEAEIARIRAERTSR
jgi:hypothetical protein